jgi:hypothetical protein
VAEADRLIGALTRVVRTIESRTHHSPMVRTIRSTTRKEAPVADEWARIPGKDGLGRPDTMLVEPRDGGTSVLFSTPPAGIKLDRHGLDLLLQRLGYIRRGMPGEVSGS